MKSYSVVKKSLFVFLVVIFMALAIALATLPGLEAFASEEKIAFEKGDVKAELVQMGFDLNDYPKDTNGSVTVFTFMEYGYSEYVNVIDDYGLYFYIYNPQEKQFDFTSGKNLIQMGSAYDSNGVCTDYVKYQIGLVNSSDNGRYLKLKVLAGLSKIHSLVESTERRYDISGIELYESGALNAVEYSVATTFYFSGFAKGYARDTEAESTLTCRTVELETIELEVNHTTYKAWNSDNVSGQELATVYFNVPDRYFNEYGALQQIKAEWLYSVTDYIYCTNIKDLYNKFLPMLGKDILQDKSMGYYLAGDIYYGEFGGADYVDVYNYAPNSSLFNIVSRVNSLNWLMYAESSSLDDVHIKSEDLLKFYITNKDNANLLSHVDDSKTSKVIDAGTTYDLKGLDGNHSGWEWLWEYLGFTETVAKVNPIYIVTDADANLSDEDFASQLKVNISDVGDIKSNHAEAGSKTVLFRFAINDFISDECEVGIHSSYDAPEIDSDDGVYRMKLPLYQDFDIIWLGFQKNGKLTIVPAVSNPTTVIGNTEPPKNNPDKDWSGDALIDSILPDDVDDTLKQIMEIIAKIVGGIIIAFLAFVIIKIIIALKPKIFKVKYKESKPKAKSKNVKKNKGVKPPKI